MKILVGLAKLNYLLGKGITIAVCSVLNFAVSDGLVFVEPEAGSQSM
jgi:hypothetical protein